MTRSPIAASVVIIGLVVGVPALVLRRLMVTELMPLRSSDLFLVVCLVLWGSVVRALSQRGTSVDVTDPTMHPLQDGIARLVDHSVLGVGFDLPHHDEHPTPLSMQVTAPLPVEALELPVPLAVPEQVVVESEPVIVQVLELEAEPTYSGPTVDYVVVRGDTWWSVADAVFEDGRRWQELLRMNLGRDVGDNHVVTEGDDLRIGWSILLPATALHEESDHAHV